MLFDVLLLLCFLSPAASGGLSLTHTCQSLESKPNHFGGFFGLSAKKGLDASTLASRNS